MLNRCVPSCSLLRTADLGQGRRALGIQVGVKRDMISSHEGQEPREVISLSLSQSCIGLSPARMSNWIVCVMGRVRETGVQLELGHGPAASTHSGSGFCLYPKNTRGRLSRRDFPALPLFLICSEMCIVSPGSLEEGPASGDCF